MERFFKNTKLAASLSVISNLILILLKLMAGYISGSISIISEAIHSGSDLLASIIAFYAVHKSDKPADSDHQFGHGKYEDVAGFIEGCLIILASLYIVYEASKKLSGLSEPIDNSILALSVMFFSVIANLFVSSYLFKVAKASDSIAIYSDAQHLKTDVYSSLAVFIGLLIINFTNLHILDALIALVVAMIIMNTGVKICKRTLNDILDGSLPESDIMLIKEILNKNSENTLTKIKEIKTRKAGKDKEIVITLCVDGNLTVKYTHDLCDKLENEIEKSIGNTKITIHIEPDETTETKR